MIKNFLFVLKRFKTSSILNILGLSVAFAAFIIILMQVDYDYNFDTFHKNSDRIYRIELVYGDNSKQAVISRPLAELWFQSSPHIVAGSISSPWQGSTLIDIEKNGSKFTSLEAMLKVSSDFTRVFQFDMLEGLETALNDPGSIMIPQSMAKKLYGNESALNKSLGENLTVKGVYKDFPVNSSLKNCIYIPISNNENLNEWGNWNYYIYVRLDNPQALAEVRETMIETLRKSLTSEFGDAENRTIQLTVLPDLRFTTDVTYDYLPKSSRQTIFVLFSIAIAIIVVATINFTNFSMALIPRRIRSINTQKILGASIKQLRTLLISEAIGISLIAYGLALIMVHLVSKTPIAGLLDSGINITAFPGLLITTALIAIFTGVISGLYPAFYITSFQPAMVLKGSFGLSPQGQKMRNLLIGVQFVASFVLIMSVFFMYLQNNFMKKMDLGFNKDQVIITDLSDNIRKNYDVFENELKTFAGIEDVTFANILLSSQDTYMGWGRKYQDKNINYQCLPVHPSFLRVMGIKITEGRDFREDDNQLRHGKYIFNEKARTKYDLQLNTAIDSAEIIGFMTDIQFTTFYTTPTPMAFYVWGTENWGDQTAFSYIKVNAGSDMQKSIQHVRNTLTKLDPNWTFTVKFFDEAIQNIYQKEQNLTLMITLFSAIAILISIIGVFGLIIFETTFRRKEISIRKVHGSTITEILALFNKIYLIILGICFLIACPITYYAVSKWLENFAYKIPVYWWVFLLGGLLVFLITLLTVTVQSYQAAVKNPTKALNME